MGNASNNIQLPDGFKNVMTYCPCGRRIVTLVETNKQDDAPNPEPKPRHEYRGQTPRWTYGGASDPRARFLGWHGDYDLWHLGCGFGDAGFTNATTRDDAIVAGWCWHDNSNAVNRWDSPHAAALITARTRAAWLGLCPPLRLWLKDEPRYARKVDGLVYLGLDDDDYDIYWRDSDGKAFYAAGDNSVVPPSPCQIAWTSYKLARSRARDLGLAVGMSEEEKQAKREEIEQVRLAMLDKASDELLAAQRLFERQRDDIEAEHKRKLAALEADDADDKS
jgi:hypothetical protein